MLKKVLKLILTIIAIFLAVKVFYNFYSENNTNNSLLINGELPSAQLSKNNSNTVSSNQLQNIDFEESDTNSRSQSNIATNYYYNQLDNNSKIIYSTLYKNIDLLKTDNYKIDFSTTFNNLLNTAGGKNTLDKSFQSAIDAFIYDHPEIFYLDISKMSLLTKSTSFMGKTTYAVSIVPNGKNSLVDSFENQTQVENAIHLLEKLKTSIVSNVSGNDYNKTLIVHDTLVDLIEYDKSTTRKNSHNIYGALIEKNCVCEGYAKAFKYLMDNLNIPCILVSGTAKDKSNNPESHMWNYIYLNNNWYGIDVTWDDPIYVGGNKPHSIDRTYFCKGYYSFKESHFIENKLSDTGMAFSIPNLALENFQNQKSKK